jgi:hypothetical protein
MSIHLILVLIFLALALGVGIYRKQSEMGAIKRRAQELEDIERRRRNNQN